MERDKPFEQIFIGPADSDKVPNGAAVIRMVDLGKPMIGAADLPETVIAVDSKDLVSVHGMAHPLSNLGTAAVCAALLL
jgi:hypothetical protein